jgi:hypothetical protein
VRRGGDKADAEWEKMYELVALIMRNTVATFMK